MKQSKLRKRRVWRFAVLYFVMFVAFMAFLIGPVFAGNMILDATKDLVKKPEDLFHLFQPTGFNNNDTRGTLATGVSAWTESCQL